MLELLERLQTHIEAWFHHRQSERPESSSRDLPAEAKQALIEAIANLPPHPVHCEALAEAIARSLTTRDEPSEARNALVVLSSPVEPFGPILQAVLKHPPWALYPVAVVDTIAARATQPAAVLAELRQNIDTLPAPVATPQAEAQTEIAKIAALEDCEIDPIEIAAIPALSECFVRCIEGMNGIESVWTTLARDTSRFWIVGCNQWAWKYLKRTTQIHSYFSNTLQLPALKGPELQAWLAPVQAQLEQILPDITIPEWSEESDRQFYDALAHAANGLAIAAAPIWLESFQLEILSNESNHDDSVENPSFKIKRNKPSRPRLPELDNSDRYLLYSVLLHGGTNIERLAQGLGDSVSTVGSQVRQLLRSRVLVLREDNIRVNPPFYPGLKSSLHGHNFLVD
ncbi:MAG: hypothetical protein AAF704_17930 [Cyanobacteria bacterium P01_D01_bin.123]